MTRKEVGRWSLAYLKFNIDVETTKIDQISQDSPSLSAQLCRVDFPSTVMREYKELDFVPQAGFEPKL